jgi:cation:H+ antiporter
MLELLNMFIVSLALLAISSRAAIKYSIRFSKLTGLSQLAVGFVLLAVATSVPELSIAAISTFEGQPLLSVGNVLGANISNLLLVFGVMALLVSFRVSRINYRQLLRAVSMTSLIVMALLIFGGANWMFGIALIIIFFAFCWTITRESTMIDKNRIQNSEPKHAAIVKTALIILVALTGVVIAARVVTDSAIALAGQLGIAESLIGATILAIGTTLPELSVNIAAVRKGAIGLAIGDSVGSIVTNTTLVLGVASLGGLALGPVSRAAGLAFIAVAFGFLLLSSRATFNRRLGVILIALYIAFILGLVALEAFFI